MKSIRTVILALTLMGMAYGVAHATSTLFGTAVSDGGVIKVSSNASPLTYGGVSFTDADGTLFSSLTALSVDYNVTDDDCGWGSPRFSIRMDTNNDTVSDGNIFVYLGPTPNFTGCTTNTWVNTGNLVGSSDARFDLTQLGGPFYGTYAQALASFGSGTILRISLVVDGGGSQGDGEQEVWFDNTNINGTTYDFTPVLTPASKDECKKDGWMTFNSPVFKNQGDCVSYVQSSENAVGNKTK